MSHYEARLEHDLGEIRRRIGAVGESVNDHVRASITALAERDCDALYNVVLSDHPINREIRAIDAECHRFIARHLPAARHLRFISSVLRMTIALERIGDYATAIARIGVRLTAPVPDDILDQLRAGTVTSCEMLGKAMRSFLESDLDLARQTRPMAADVDARTGRIFDLVLTQHEDLGRLDTFSILAVAYRIERVSDQSKNIAEEAIFVITGKTKPPKVYKVLFVDSGGRVAAPLASALASKAFPNSGVFRSMSLAPADAFAPVLVAGADRLGLDLVTDVPAPLDEFRQSPPEAHVIVVVDGTSRDVLPRIPFESSVLRWQLMADGEPVDDAGLDALARDLVPRIRHLMETLRGDSAD